MMYLIWSSLVWSCLSSHFASSHLVPSRLIPFHPVPSRPISSHPNLEVAFLVDFGLQELTGGFIFCLSHRPSGTEDVVRVYAEADTQVSTSDTDDCSV